MKFSKAWLEQHLQHPLPLEPLLEKLAMAGLEIGSAEPAASDFSKVVVACVKTIEAHPDAKKLSICQVDAGQGDTLTIVCGASNVTVGMLVPCALIGGHVGELKIKQAKLRGIDSFGMLCSAKELGLAESSDGIHPLPADAPLGECLSKYLNLDDTIVDLELTPNRGDCLGIDGLARETAACFAYDFTTPIYPEVPNQCDDVFNVSVQAEQDCPRYVGRVIKNVDVNKPAPIWMQERLRRCGLRSINPVVDVTNYVMLELGQPMHAFDLAQLNEGIIVRKANANEKLQLLDEQVVELNQQTLVIADHKQALAIAGVMGGKDSGVDDKTKSIFLESAFFAPELLAGRARQYGLHTDSSHRFERGVDPQLQVKAVQRATQLLLDIVGGEPGPVIEQAASAYLIKPQKIQLRKAQIQRLLGITIKDAEVSHILQSLDMQLQPTQHGWEVVAPTNRFDIRIEEDLIEEIARIYGYAKIPSEMPIANLNFIEFSEQTITLNQFRKSLVDRGYHEAITYSFVDVKLQALLDTKNTPIALLNPISSDLAVMRTSLIPGLINALLHNAKRQQPRIRLFESGLSFIQQEKEIIQDKLLAAVCWGQASELHWDQPNRSVDFYDCKGDLEALLANSGDEAEFTFASCQRPMLHPGKSAEILRNGEVIGVVGALHPSILESLDIQGDIYLFELNLDSLSSTKLPKFAKLSKYPSIRRDIAIVVDKQISAAKVSQAIRETGGDWLIDLQLFDVYMDYAGDSSQRSLGLALTLQDPERTLVDDEVNTLMDKIIICLKDEFKATLRN